LASHRYQALLTSLYRRQRQSPAKTIWQRPSDVEAWVQQAIKSRSLAARKIMIHSEQAA